MKSGAWVALSGDAVVFDEPGWVEGGQWFAEFIDFLGWAVEFEAGEV